jgi:hypothetical protein
MNCVQRLGVYAFFAGAAICAQGLKAFAKGEGNKENGTAAVAAATSTSATEFQWAEHGRLSWNDFRGPVRPQDDETAAATHCGMGFKTVTGNDGKPQVVVYNKFYTNKSWVRSDAKLDEILGHEQGHFDLCELYTRKLRKRMANFNFSAKNASDVLYDLYFQVNTEYERRQQAYEDETTHGINTPVQQKWQRNIAKELSETEAMAQK